MRDVNRIDSFCDTLKLYWKTYFPDWRFGQFINNIQRFAGNDLFYYEEDKFLKLLDDFVNSI